MGSERGGGQNKTHGTVEQHPALDSFKVNRMPLGKHSHVAEDGTGATVDIEPKEMQISFLYSDPGKQISQHIKMHHVTNNLGSKPRAYFLCPHCGRHARFLYLNETVFECRICAKLNYSSQQLTHGLKASVHRMDSVLQKGFGMKNIPAPIDACRLTPERPKWMRQRTYEKKLMSLHAAQSSFEDAVLKKFGALVGKH